GGRVARAAGPDVFATSGGADGGGCPGRAGRALAGAVARSALPRAHALDSAGDRRISAARILRTAAIAGAASAALDRDRVGQRGGTRRQSWPERTLDPTLGDVWRGLCDCNRVRAGAGRHLWLRPARVPAGLQAWCTGTEPGALWCGRRV